MSTAPPRKRSNILSFITLIIILLTFGYYYFYYVPYKKSQFTEQAFRIIERVSLNVEAKAANYQKIIDNTLKGGQYLYQATIQEDIQKRLIAVDFPKELRIISVKKISETDLKQSITFTNGILKFDYFKKIDNGYLKVEFECKGTDFFPNTLRYDFFNRYVMFTKDKVVYSDIPATGEVVADSLKFSGPLGSSRQITILLEQKENQLYFVPVSIDGTTLYVGGVTDQHYFDTITHSLSPLTYTVIIFLIILLVVAMPYLKLYFITEKERLNTWDAIFSFFVLLFGSAFLIVMLIYYLQQQGPEKHLRVNFLKSVSDKMLTNFQAEIGDMINQIDYDEAQLLDQANKQQSENWKYDLNQIGNKKEFFQVYPHYNAITWINSSADQIAKWNKNNITARVNTGSRNYFSKVHSGQLFADTDCSAHPFYLESIYSQTEGLFYAVVSKKSSIKVPLDLDNQKMKLKGDSALFPEVVMATTQLKSLNNQKLPDHVSYMVIDASGNVLFHRNPRKQLQENFLAETNYNHILNDCLHSQTENYFVSNYDTQRRFFFVKPMGQLPLYLVTYLDFEYERLVDVQILGLSSALYIGFLFLFVFLIALFVYADYEVEKKIMSYNLFFKWVWPNKSKSSLYILLTGFFIISILLYVWGDFYHSVSMSYSFFMMLVITSILCLRQFKTRSEFFSRISYISFFGILYAIGFFVLFYSLHAIKISSFYGLLYVGLSCFTIYLSYKKVKIKIGSTDRYIKNYNLFIFIIVVAFGIVPVLSFFKRSFDYEKELYLKNIQLNMAEQCQKVPASDINSKYQQLDFSNKCFLRFSAEPISEIPKNNPEDENKTPLSVFMQDFQLGSTTSFFTSHHLNDIENSSNRPFFWNKEGGDLQLFVKGKPPIKITSGIIRMNGTYLFNTEITPWQLFAVFASLFILFLAFINRMVVYWTRRIFLLGLLPVAANDLKESLEQLKHHSLIISASFSEGVNYLKRHFLDKKHLWIDLTNPPSNLTPDMAVQIVNLNNLEAIVLADYKPFDKEIISLKIKWIKSVLACNSDSQVDRVRIFVVTPYLPVHNDDIEDPDQLYMVRKYLEVVSGFKKSYFPLGYENDELLKEVEVHDKLTKKLKQELLYLPSFELKESFEFLNAQRRKLKMDKNDLILYVQSNEQMLYHSLWNNCTLQEQYLIFDLAQDGLLNSKNLPDIYNLLQKGIMVHKDGRLKLFNHSFQNFVLSVISPKHALEIEHDAKMEGGWANSQLPIIMVIFGLLLFLFVSQQDIFNYLIGWVTAALGSIPILTRGLAGLAGLKVLKFSSKE